jgi:glycosyltransferase involved in cell wall biosynthesis
MMSRVSTKVVFLSGVRYSQPLDATNEKKFRVLKSLGEIFVIGFSHDMRPRRFTEHARFYLLPKLPLPLLRYAEMFLIGPSLVLWLILRHGVQVLVAQSPYEGFAAALAKKIGGSLGYNVVLVVESHGDYEKSLFMQRRILLPGLYRLLMRHAARFALAHADLLRAISNFTEEQLGRKSPGKLIVRFPTWTDIEVFLQDRINREKTSSQDILYAGVLTPLKGVHYLINAFVLIAKEFPKARLFIVGHEKNKSYSAQLEEQVRRFGLSRRVQFVGSMPQAELAAWMRKACVFVLPSASEGLGRVVVEAMATGMPVIGSHVGGIPVMVQEGTTGFLVPPGDEAALAKQIRWVLEHPEKACEMGHRARAFAERFFSNEAYVDGYRQIFGVAEAFLTEDGEHAPSPL